MPSITEFSGQFSRNGGMAMANRYEVEFNLPNLGTGDAIRTMNLLCDGVALPPRQITTVDYQAHKQAIKVPIGFTNEDITFNFIVTNDYFAKKAFDSWIESIMDFANYQARYMDEWTRDIRVYQLAKNDFKTEPDRGTPDLPYVQQMKEKRTYGVIFYKAYPTSVGGIVFENAAENTPQKLSVTFAYENFKVLSDQELG